MELRGDLGEIPPKRTGHVAVAFNRAMIVWGGYQDNSDSNPMQMEVERYLPATDIWIYHTDIDQWRKLTTRGDVPPGTSGASAVQINHKMYVACGHCDGIGNTNKVYRLDLETLKWESITTDIGPSPRDKCSIWEYRDEIYLFGGFGYDPVDYLNEDGEYTKDLVGAEWGSYRGWNNQLHVFDPGTRKWRNPRCKGPKPLPRAAVGASRCGNKAYIFGGRHIDERLNDLHILNLDTLTWSGIMASTGSVPEGRSWHTFTAVSDTHIFLYGGFTTQRDPKSDGWLLDTRTLLWTQLNVPLTNPRLWHTMVRTSEDDILIYGGCCNNILDHTQKMVHSFNVLVYRFSPRSLLRMCLECAFTNRKQLKKDWENLPKSLTGILTHKLEAIELNKASGS
ncbi:unnamed protein product [Owenia fusiformis]|uniref:Uncharacterized protein n=1 Tax=Owenia fusiformis TaxID=6347 RepID=A0A8J1UP60_OWEFU|nr:unnamed protein product [Owenia fusiformis]